MSKRFNFFWEYIVLIVLFSPLPASSQVFVGGAISPNFSTSGALVSNPINLSFEYEYKGLSVLVSANTSTVKAGLVFGNSLQFSCLYVQELNKEVLNRVELGLRYRFILKDKSFIEIGANIQTNVDKSPVFYYCPFSIGYKKRL